jgi:glycerophosphoryl diester phosphodiesterase
MRCKIFIATLLLTACNKKEKFENVQLIGHAGSGLQTSAAPYHADSYEAVEYAAELEGISGVEVDVQLSASNTAWLFHDEQLGNTTNGSGCVNGQTDDYLSGLHYTTLEKEVVSRLSEIAGLFGSRQLILDLKSANLCTNTLVDLPEMIAAIKTALPDIAPGNLIVITNKPQWVHTLALEGWKVYLEQPTLQSYTDNYALAETTGACLRSAEIDREGVEQLHDMGKEVIIFDVRSPKGLRKALKKYPDYLMTDNLKAALIEKYP